MARAKQTSRPTSTVEQAPEDCQECGGQVQMDRAAAEAACTDCGLVHEDDAIDLGPDWRRFSDDQSDPTRTGSPMTSTRHDKGLTTTIGAGRTDRDARGNTLSESQRQRASRLQREHGRTVRSTRVERNATYGLIEIRRITTALEMPEVVTERACELFQEAQESNLFSGRDLDSFTGAVVYAACREHDCPIVRNDVVEYARVSDRRITVAFVVLKRQLELEILPFNPSDHVPRLINGLGLPVDVSETVGEVTQAVEETGLHSGRSPSGLAAGAVYYAVGDQRDVTQSGLGEIADVSNKTVRDAVEFLEDCEAVPEV